MVTPVILHTTFGNMAPELADELTARLDEPPQVAETPEESHDLLSSAEVAIAGRFPDEFLESANDLRWLQAMSAGVDFIDQEAFVARGIALTNAAGVHPQPAAEQTFGCMLTFERQLHVAIENHRRGVWERYSPGELAGKTLGVVGLGAIGARIAELGQAFGMTVIGTKRDTASVPASVDEVYAPADLREVLTRSEYLVLACPLTEDTRGMIGEEQLRAMKSDAVLVNVARGGVVDQDALVRALQYRHIRGAALDVFEEEPLPADSPLWDLSNVLVTPHVAGSTPRYAERLAEIFVRNYERYLETGVDELENRVI